jgi:hypothetical protein
MKGAAVLTAKAGDAICSLSDINCLVPRYNQIFLRRKLC